MTTPVVPVPVVVVVGRSMAAVGNNGADTKAPAKKQGVCRFVMVRVCRFVFGMIRKQTGATMRRRWYSVVWGLLAGDEVLWRGLALAMAMAMAMAMAIDANGAEKLRER